MFCLKGAHGCECYRETGKVKQNSFCVYVPRHKTVCEMEV